MIDNSASGVVCPNIRTYPLDMLFFKGHRPISLLKNPPFSTIFPDQLGAELTEEFHEVCALGGQVLGASTQPPRNHGFKG